MNDKDNEYSDNPYAQIINSNQNLNQFAQDTNHHAQPQNQIVINHIKQPQPYYAQSIQQKYGNYGKFNNIPTSNQGYLPPNQGYLPQKQGYLHLNHGYVPPSLAQNYQYSPYNPQFSANIQNNQYQSLQPQLILPSRPCIQPSSPTVFIKVTHSQNAVHVAQMNHCQKCGLGQTVGPLRFSAGCAAYSWGTCLWATTCIFCWVPCVMDSCKDVHVSCARCGNKKAIIKKQCC